MTQRDITDLTPEQQDLYKAVARLATETGDDKVPLQLVEDALGTDRSGLVDLLTEHVLDTFLDYREDKPYSPGWLALDNISA